MVRKFKCGLSLFSILLMKLRAFLHDDRVRGVGVALWEGDEELVEIAEYAGVPIIPRSEKSVMGKAPIGVALGFLRDLECDYIAWINGCLPLLRVSTLNAVLENFPSCGFKSVTSVKAVYNWFWGVDGRPLNTKDPRVVATQDSACVLESVHAFHIYPRLSPVDDGRYWNLEPNDPYLCEVHQDECFDVDDDHGWLVADVIVSSMVESGKFWGYVL
jgi:hypothetical protein